MNKVKLLTAVLTAAATVAALPSITASPQPETPASVRTSTMHHLGRTK